MNSTNNQTKPLSDLEGMMDLIEGIISNAANEACGTYELEYKGNRFLVIVI